MSLTPKTEKNKNNSVSKIFQNTGIIKKRHELSEKLNGLSMSLAELLNKLLDSKLSSDEKFAIQVQIESIKSQQHQISVQLINLLDEDYVKQPVNKYKP